MDCVSQYPSIAMNSKFPVGEPIILIGNMLQDVVFINSKFWLNGQELIGIAEVVVCPPKNMDRPVLSLKTKSGCKLYSLCKICSNELSLITCNHNDKDRSWVGVYTFDELEYAQMKGYRFKFLEAYVYEKETYLFTDFIRILGLEKMKSSKLPDGVDPETYCFEVNRSMGLTGSDKICPKDLSYNHEHREFVKSSLNSFLGKIGQKNDYIKAHYAYNHNGILALENKSREIWNIDLVNDHVCHVYTKRKGHPPLNLNGNVIIYAILTARGRISMQKTMDELEYNGCRVFSISTDAIAFRKVICCDLPDDFEGFTFGKFQDEFSGIRHYSSLGPKNYCVVSTKDGNLHTTLRVSGLTINVNTQNSLNQKVYKEAVDNWLKANLYEVKVPQAQTKVYLKNPFEKLMKIHSYDRFFRNNIFKRRAVIRDKKNVYTMTRPYGFTE